jgi:hypothetical protein
MNTVCFSIIGAVYSDSHLIHESKFEPMAIIQIHELPGMTREQYEQPLGALNLSGPPPGSHLHAGGPMEGGWRIVEVWESEEAANRFYGSVPFQQMVRSTGILAPRITSYPVETVRV